MGRLLLKFIFTLYYVILYKNTVLLIYYENTVNIYNRHQKYISNIYWLSAEMTFPNYAFNKYKVKITKM